MSQPVAGLTTENLGVTQGYGGVREPPFNFAVGANRQSCVSRVVIQVCSDLAGCLSVIAPCPKRGKRQRETERFQLQTYDARADRWVGV